METLRVRKLKIQRDAQGNFSLEENLFHFQRDWAPHHYVFH